MDHNKINFNEFDFTNNQSLSPKEILKTFLRKSVINEPYAIKLEGSYQYAEKFLHRMRVELSRLRQQVIQMNKRPAKFKILLKEIVDLENGSHNLIIVRTEKTTLAKETLNDIINELTADSLDENDL